MYSSCEGGQAHGMRMGFPLEPRIAPSQLPVPSGLTPDWNPSAGARAETCASERSPPLAAGEAAAGAGVVAAEAGLVAAGAGVVAAEAGGAGAGAAAADPAGAGATTVAGFRPALIAACCRENVVETIGQPLPGPFRFWRVTAAAFRRAD